MITTMNIHNKKVIDHLSPLEIGSQEEFCKEYVRLDIEERIINKRARRIKAYRNTYKDSIMEQDGVINSRAVTLLKKDYIMERIATLYDEEGTSIEQQFNWTTSKAEELLVAIAHDDELKTADRLKAISELNKMRGIDAPVIIPEEKEVDSTDSVEMFFSMIKKGV